MINTFEISGMRCESCVEKLDGALRAVSGVTDVEVTLNPPRARVQMGPDVSIQKLTEATKRVGDYSVRRVANEDQIHSEIRAEDSDQSLTPLFVVAAYIVGGVALRSSISADFSFHTLMENFMGGFFVIFSLFKLINLQGFADGYSTYDIIAKRSRAYALAYPFLELGLGIAYLMSLAPVATNVATLVLMSIGAVGVAQALKQKRTIQCACLGTALKLPMTKVTLAEDLLMAVMAFFMLIL